MPSGINYAWPYLGAAIALIYMGHRGFATYSLDWLTCIQLPIYALHQFEAHAIDFFGRSHASLHFLRGTLLLSDQTTNDLAETLPRWITLVNVGAVWPWGLQATYHGLSEPLVGLSFAGLMAANAFAHTMLLFRGEGYAPGMATALLLFVPISASMFQRYTNAGKPWERKVSGAQAWAALAAGVVSHWVIPESIGLVGDGGLWGTARVAVVFGAFGLGAPWVVKWGLEMLPGIAPAAVAPGAGGAATKHRVTIS